MFNPPRLNGLTMCNFRRRLAHAAVLVAADEIKSYDWASQTLTLTPGVRERLKRNLPLSRIVAGIPFSVTIGGNVAFSGVFSSTSSSRSFDSPVILIDGVQMQPELGADQVCILLGYPTEEFFKGADPGADVRLRAALEATGKLILDARDHTEWIARSLREMQTIKVGMTRQELLNACVEEGGLSTRSQRRYAYRDCPHIKVDVRFDPVGDADDKLDESPQDKISSLSQPFLEWSIID